MPISRLKCFQNHLVVYCLAVKWESLLRLVGGAWYFLNLISTWLPGHKLSHFTAKQYTTRCFWKHLRREIGITVTEYWFIFDQRCLVWPFDRSSRVIDSCSETARLQLGSDWLFSSGLWNLADAIRSTGGHRGTWFFSDYLSHALHACIKITFFHHICSNLPTPALSKWWLLYNMKCEVQDAYQLVESLTEELNHKQRYQKTLLFTSA